MMNFPVLVRVPSRQDAAGLGSAGLVGRDNTLDKLATRIEGLSDSLEATDDPSTIAVTGSPAAVSLHGHGGLGKTALATEYCNSQHAADRFQLIWWISSETEATTAQSFRDLLDALDIGVDDRQDIRQQVAYALEQFDRWIAVFDNVLDKETLSKWQPTNPGGLVVATTRSNRGWSKVESFSVDLISDSDAKGWLLSAARSPELTQNPAEHQAADKLVELLGGLPLALSMAAAFVANTPVSLVTYLEAFEEDRGVGVLTDADSTHADYDKTVYQALAVARDRLKIEDTESAVLMLEYASFFAPDRIPMYLFTPESLGVETKAGVLKAKKALVERSLITPDPEDDGFFSVHRLVQAVTRHRLEHSNQDVAEPNPARKGQSEDAEASVFDWDVFLAHAGADKDSATELFGLLTGDCQVFLDSESIRLGDDWDTTLARAQRRSRYTVVLVSSRTPAAYYERTEIAVAIKLARKGAHRVIPIYLDDAEEPYGLELKHGMRLSDQLDLSGAAARLLDEVQQTD